MDFAFIALATLKLVVAKVSSMNILYLLSFLGGAAMVLGLSSLGGNTLQHVYELRIYHVNEGKLEALKDRFGNHTDAIFKRHNMKTIGYWVPEDAPDSQNYRD